MNNEMDNTQIYVFCTLKIKHCIFLVLKTVTSSIRRHSQINQVLAPHYNYRTAIYYFYSNLIELILSTDKIVQEMLGLFRRCPISNV
jgi:hypothetical protein